MLDYGELREVVDPKGKWNADLAWDGSDDSEWY